MISCSEWTGVPLSVLLGEVGVKSGASWIFAEGADSTSHGKSMPIAKAMQDVLELDQCSHAASTTGVPHTR